MRRLQIMQEKLCAGIRADRHRWSLWVPVAMVAGAGGYFALPFEPAFAWVWAGAAAVSITGVAAKLAPRLGLKIVLALTAAAALGFTAARLRTEIVAAPVLTKRIGPVHFDARVVQAEPRGNGSRLVLAPLWDDANAMPKKVRVTVRARSSIPAPGSWVHVLAILMPPPSPSMPGDYDFGRWAFYKGIGAVGYLYGTAKPIPPPRPPTPIERWQSGLERLRTEMTAHIRTVVPGANGVIAGALITGERADIDPEDQAAFRDSGLMHVLSISGLHLALAGGFFFWIIRALFAAFPSIVLNYPIKKWAAVGALSGATFYLLISGSEPPAVRSWVMLAMMFLAVLADRPALSMRAVGIAAILIVLFTPESVFDAGWQMSFAAVIGLIALAEWHEMHRRDEEPRNTILRRVWRYGLGIAVTSTIAGLATAPIAIFHFDRASPFGLVANLLALPVVSVVIMPGALAAMVAMPFGLDTWPLLWMGKGVGAMLWIAHWVADLPGAGTMVPSWPAVSVAAVMGGGLWIALWLRAWRWFGLIPIAAGLAYAMTVPPPDILIAGDGKTVALRLDSGALAFIDPPADEYAAANWLRRAGDERAVEAAVGGTGMACDALGCVARLRGVAVAVDKRAEALAEDCARNRIVIAMLRAHAICPAPLVIDRRDTAKGGAHAIWLGETVIVKAAEDARGDRPWTPHVIRQRLFSNGGSGRRVFPAP